MIAARRLLKKDLDAPQDTAKRRRFNDARYANMIHALPSMVADRIIQIVYTKWLHTGHCGELVDVIASVPVDCPDAERLILERLLYVFMWIQRYNMVLVCASLWHDRYGHQRRFVCHDIDFSLLHLCTLITPVEVITYLTQVLKCDANQCDQFGRTPGYCFMAHVSRLDIRSIPICWKLSDSPGLLSLNQAYRACFHCGYQTQYMLDSGLTSGILEHGVWKALVQAGAQEARLLPHPNKCDPVLPVEVVDLIQAHQHHNDIRLVEVHTVLSNKLTVEATFVLACALEGWSANCQMAWLWLHAKGGKLPTTVRVRNQWVNSVFYDIPVLKLLIGATVDHGGWLIERLLLMSATSDSGVDYTYCDMLLDACTTINADVVRLIFKYFPHHSVQVSDREISQYVTPYHKLVKSPLWIGTVPGKCYQRLTTEACRVIQCLNANGYVGNAVDGTGMSALDWLVANLPHSALRSRNVEWWTMLCDTQKQTHPFPSLGLLVMRQALAFRLQDLPKHVISSILDLQCSPMIHIEQLLCEQT